MSAGTLLRLPHTGLSVPHTRIAVVAPGLVGLDGEPVGQIDTDRDTHETRYRPLSWRPPSLTEAEFGEFVGECRTESGGPVGVEQVLYLLDAEYGTGRALWRAATHGETVAQRLDPYGDGYLPDETLRVRHDANRMSVQVRAVAAGGPAGCWWRIWDGEAWQELRIDEGVRDDH